MKIAKPIQDLIDSFQKLPGIGPKSAERLTYYLLRVPQQDLDSFASALENLKKNTMLCTNCKNISEQDPCSICSDTKKDPSIVLVVEEPLDIIVFEKTGRYHGIYHVLHGAINPLENIGPDELYIDDLLERVKNQDIKELIIATNPNMEGEATTLYITKQIREKLERNDIKITRLGMGIPTGADLGYADSATLTSAIEGRREL